jgi:N-acetylglucosaminyldiphosphoundecaprenol N-acetyl-beta-D-mannosaminyltransferase
MSQNITFTLPPPHHIANIPVHPITLQELLNCIRQTITHKKRAQVMYANAYAVNLAQHNRDFLTTLQKAEIVFCDGYGVWLAAQLLKRPLPERFTPPDWIMELIELCAEQHYRIFLLGSESWIVEKVASQFLAIYPQLQITTQHGYFETNGKENETVLQKINETLPDIILVGMGMPRQELWIEQNYEHHTTSVIISVGALFDYLAGHVKRGPRWMTDSGGEWLWRLYSEPTRLWRRYLLGNPRFVWLVLRQWQQKHRLFS